MKYCQNCGAQINDPSINFCPTCGGQLNSGVNMNQGQSFNNAVANKVVNRSIVTCILLSIVTCGIYGIIWYINMVNDVNSVCQDGKSSGGTVFLLTLITCGIYGWVWWYNAGERMGVANKKYGKSQSDNAVLYLVLTLFGLGIVNYCLLQNNLNEYSN